MNELEESHAEARSTRRGMKEWKESHAEARSTRRGKP